MSDPQMLAQGAHESSRELGREEDRPDHTLSLLRRAMGRAMQHHRNGIEGFLDRCQHGGLGRDRSVSIPRLAGAMACHRPESLSDSEERTGASPDGSNAVGAADGGRRLPLVLLICA